MSCFSGGIALARVSLTGSRCGGRCWPGLEWIDIERPAPQRPAALRRAARDGHAAGDGLFFVDPVRVCEAVHLAFSHPLPMHEIRRARDFDALLAISEGVL